MSRLKDHAPSVLVAGISAAFGVALLRVTAVIGTAAAADSATSGETAGLVLGVVAAVFIVIAMYVAAIVTANTFSTILAGRTRTIALRRLLGSTASAERRAVAGEGLVVGVVGSLLGLAVGTAVAAGLTALAVALGHLPDLDYGVVDGSAALPVIAVALTTWLASWVGSRRVLDVTPMQALGGAQERTGAEAAGRGRRATALVLVLVGLGLVGLGVVLGLISPLGVLVGLIGGILSFTGLVTGSAWVMPPALRLVGRLFGGSAAARLAAENALRYPERSSRTTIGLVIGVTLITMFAVGTESLAQIIRAIDGGSGDLDAMLTTTVTVLSVLLGFSALIAAIGMVNNLFLSVLQRTRELGLLRALGFTAAQIRRMILAESAQLTLAALLVGVALGTFYGWAGAQALLGSVNGAPGLVLPGMPWPVLTALAAGSALLTWVASLAPSRRATRVSPIAALAVS
ncbi:ABC transporter permease [Naasia sp. SYSU D00057]|uniref:ABC transporter permease n=1 Tax=Naasia sp. SYSU D00057 TaxID=2817380 RepID=UPI001B306671|nr:ABC transporter permease [Naasia sp. SYSU D00057]